MGFELNRATVTRLAACCTLPLLADADTGYGNAVNVYHTTRAFEQAGVAGLMIEDQTWPKRCRFDQYRDLQAQGLSLRQAAKALDVPRSTLQAWRASQESLDEPPAVVAFFHRAPGLACLPRLVLGLHLVCTAGGACGILPGVSAGETHRT
jgi:hypothetical protein